MHGPVLPAGQLTVASWQTLAATHVGRPQHMEHSALRRTEVTQTLKSRHLVGQHVSCLDVSNPHLFRERMTHLIGGRVGHVVGCRDD